MVEEGYDAWNRGDFDAMVKDMADDAEWRTGGVFPDFDPVYHGHEGVRRFWDTMHDAWELIEIRPRRFAEHGDKLLIESRFHGKGRGSGVVVELDWVQVFTYRDDMVTRIAGYPTVEDACAAEMLPDSIAAGNGRTGD
jgi:ketosteroid isomerase-like protein